MLVAFEIVPTNMSAAKGLSVQPAKFSLKYKMPKATNFLEETNAPFMQRKTLTEIDKNYQFAVSVIMFSSLLRDSRNVKTISWNEVNALATVSADLSIPSQREFLLLIQKAKTIYSKKKKGKNFKLFN
jgi:Ca-activated chloride channel family protein